MFTEIEVNSSKIKDVYDFCIDKLDESMLVLKNNAKVLSFLNNEKDADELKIMAQSLHFAIKHDRFELIQNIILGLKDKKHKFAALEIKYFDEYESLLKTDIYNRYMPENFKKHSFVTPKLKEIFDVLDITTFVSPTNAAFGVMFYLKIGDLNNANKIRATKELSQEFINQINKRFIANFGMDIDEFATNNSVNENNAKKFSLKRYNSV